MTDKQETPIFVPHQEAKSQHHHAWHGDTGGLYHFCTSTSSDNFASRGYWIFQYPLQL